jgi:hypothetical protein
MTAVLTLTLGLWWGCGALLVYRSGERAYSPWRANLPFAVLWPLTIPVSVAYWSLRQEDDMDPTE